MKALKSMSSTCIVVTIGIFRTLEILKRTSLSNRVTGLEAAVSHWDTKSVEKSIASSERVLPKLKEVFEEAGATKEGKEVSTYILGL